MPCPTTATLLRAWIGIRGARVAGPSVWQKSGQAGRRNAVSLQQLNRSLSEGSKITVAGGAIAERWWQRTAAAEYVWKFAFAGAAGSLLYHLHKRRGQDREQSAVVQSQAELQAKALELAASLVPPPPFRHPHEDCSPVWRALFVAMRTLKLLFVFAPIVAASSLLPVLSGRPDFMNWYLTLLVRTLEDAGASFQKLGQWLSMRPDLFDESVIKALSSLRDDGPRHSFAHTCKLLEEAFGCPVEHMFEHLNTEPVASGSVAQVHRGRLRDAFVRDCIANRDLDDDIAIRDVAVKVIHPGVLETAWIDGDIIFGFVQLFARVTGIGLVMPFDKDGFCGAMARQLDLKWEAYNLKQFSLNFSDDASVEFPRVVAARDAVLIESWFSGNAITQLLEAAGASAKVTARSPHQSSSASLAPPPTPSPPHLAAPASSDVLTPQDSPILLRRRSSWPSMETLVEVSEGKRKKLAAAIFDMTIKMYLRDNYIHADLHAGNLLFSPNPQDERVFVLDAGMTTALEKDWASPFGYMLHALTVGNATAVADKLLMFNVNSFPVDRAAFTAAVEEVMNLYTRRVHVDAHAHVHAQGGGAGGGGAGKAKPVDIGMMMGHILMILHKYKVSLRSDVAMTIVTMSVSEGLIRSLDPDFDVVNKAIPYFVRFRAWRRPGVQEA
jgi:predicted unusual protein kinase regulating ubiquinone biosynthesis (AarF/ABC1/UbiB family)